MLRSTHITSKEILNIAYPIMIGNLAQTLISFVDTAFLGHVGAIALGASMMAGIYYYVFATLAWGFSVCIQIIVARRYGEGNFARIGVVFEHGMLIVSGLAVLLFLLLFTVTDSLLLRLIDSPHIYAAAMQYMRYRYYGIIFVCFNYLFRSFYVGLSSTKVITYSTVLMAVVNIVLDYALIFGKLGFEAYGIGGAAIASVAAEISATLFFIIFTVKKVPRQKYSLFAFSHIELPLLRRMLRIAIPTMLQRLVSFGMWFVFFAMIEHTGEICIAVSGIVRSVYMLILIPVFAFGSTANTLTGRLIGENKKKEVMPTLAKTLKLSLLCIAPMILLCSIFPTQIAGIYTNDIDLARLTGPVIYTICIATLTMSASSIYFEAVSGTGNTRTALLMEMVVICFYCAYIYLSTDVLHLATQFVWCAEIIYSVLMASVSVLYLRFAHWDRVKI